MALTKVTKHVIYGSMIVQHVSDDLSDANTGSGWVNWGQTLAMTPQYADSHLEIVLTGSATIGDHQGTASLQGGNLRLQVNGITEYTQDNFIGYRSAVNGNQRLFNPRYSQHAIQQDWHIRQLSSGIYMTHIHAPGSTNLQTVQAGLYSSGHFNIAAYDGFLTLTEIAGDHHNIT
jgi:hypothetical protein